MPEFSTSETALVAFLALQGVRPHRTEVIRGWCHWTFRDTDRLKKYVELYDERAGRVEPNEFIREFTSLKRYALDMRAAQPA